MRLLLDTHAHAWWLLDDPRLSLVARAAIADEANEVFVSVASAWEMAVKVGLGKWPEADSIVQNFEAEVAAEGFKLLPIAISHVRTAGLMSAAHRDPFDRLLAAQALSEGLSLVTADPKVGTLGARIVW